MSCNRPRFEFVRAATDAQRHAGLPQRKTANAAGYDFTAPQTVTIAPGKTVTFPTGIKAYMPDDVVLMLYVRSSVGILRSLVLANGTGVIDADYADNPENEGNIHAALRNDGTEPQTIRAGECYMQGVFQNYLRTIDDHITASRCGGIGSTDRRF